MTEVQDKCNWHHCKDILFDDFTVLLKVNKERVFQTDLILEFKMIDHLLLAMGCQIIESDPFRKGYPLKVE